LIAENNLDALFCPGVTNSAAVAGYPSIIVPAGSLPDGSPFGVAFTSTAFNEPTLLRLAFSFEQMYRGRVHPKLKVSENGEA
jgi:amidase